MELSINRLEESNTSKDEEIALMTKLLADTKVALDECSVKLADQTHKAHICANEMKASNTRYYKLKQEYDALVFNADSLKKTIELAQKKLQSNEHEQKQIKTDTSLIAKEKDATNNKIARLLKEKTHIQIERDKLRAQFNGTIKESIDLKKQIIDTKRQVIEHTRDKEQLNIRVARMAEVTAENLREIKVKDQEHQSLREEIINCKNLKKKQAKIIVRLNQEQERLNEQLSIKNTAIEDAQDLYKTEKIKLQELNKSLTESENKLRTANNLIESTKSDQNRLVSSIREMEANNKLTQEKIYNSNLINTQLKEDIKAKTHAIIKGQADVKDLIQQRDDLRLELSKSLQEQKNLRVELHEAKATERKAHACIALNERNIRNQMKVIQTLMNERDLFNAQLMQRDKEVLLLQEKVKLLQCTLNFGDAQYQQRIDDIRLLKIEIKRLRQEKAMMTQTIHIMTDLKQELIHLERDLTRERVKNKACEDEMCNPMNIHRWRKLKGSDPDVLVLMQKIYMLQK